MKRSRDYPRWNASLFCSAGGQERRGISGGGEEEKKASAVRGRIGGTHEIIMVHIKCNLAKRMQRCIEARVGILRAVPSLCLFLALTRTYARRESSLHDTVHTGRVIFFVHPVGTRSIAPQCTASCNNFRKQ